MSGTSGKDLSVFLDARSLRFERLLPGTTDALWGWLTKPELLVRWLAKTDIDLRVGGAAEFRIMLADDTPSKTVLRGTVGQCDPPRLLSYSWDDPRSANESWITFELEARGASVRLRLTQKGVGDGALSRSAAGWHVFLGRLEDRLHGRGSRPFADVYNEALEVYEDLAEGPSEQTRGKITASPDVVLHVQSFEAATRFYGEVLGLEVVTRKEGLVGFEAGAFRLYVERGGPAGQGPVFELLVPDLAAAREKLEARGCEVVAEDPELPRCYVRDPFGLVFNLAER
jgi:uncharacterized protein YndB with AHSA1/START domain/predicted enzyme related to lactoylglutathione lyase